jgi:hypothetical protein
LRQIKQAGTRIVLLKKRDATGKLMIYRSTYKGVEFSLDSAEAPESWQWQYAIDGQIKTGRTEAKLELLAIRQVWSLIDKDLRSRHRSM